MARLYYRVAARGGPIPTLRIRDPDLFGHLGSGREGVGTLGSHFSGQIRLSGSGIRIFLVIWDPEGRELGLPDPTFRDPARLYSQYSITKQMYCTVPWSWRCLSRCTTRGVRRAAPRETTTSSSRTLWIAPANLMLVIYVISARSDSEKSDF